ncbi:MAG TPA: cytochrome c1 [Rhizomicrobium sp.]|nr:cytochrome c1 [Rhizomicrobium sp.]
MAAFFPRKSFILVALLLGAGVFPALAANNAAPAAPVSSGPLQPKHVDWSFEGPFGVYDRASLQRGFQVYKEVCSTCHALSHVAFRDLCSPGGVGFSPAEVVAIAASYKVLAKPNQHGKIGNASGAPLMRAATLADYFPPPFPNEHSTRAVMNGALPPDLSLIVNARAGHSDYVYSIITGYGQTPPANEKMARGMQYNPYYPGHQIAMPPPLTDGGVTYVDGTVATVDQQARDVVSFLAWAGDPKMEERKSANFTVILYLFLFAGLLYFSFHHIWRPWH